VHICVCACLAVCLGEKLVAPTIRTANRAACKREQCALTFKREGESLVTNMTIGVCHRHIFSNVLSIVTCQSEYTKPDF
jgi:hypothetical protein